MPTVLRVATRDRPSRPWYLRHFDSLRCGLTWRDTLVGLGMTALIAALLSGFRYGEIPEYAVGAVSAQEIRAAQDLTYEDREATAERRAAARNSIPNLYELDTQLIDGKEQEIARAFSVARDLILERQVPLQAPLPAAQQREILKELEALVGKSLPPDVLPVLLKHRFSITLENQLIKALDLLLRGGIVQDKTRFLEDQKSGIVLRDSLTPVERPLAGGYRARSLEDATTQLRQIELEFVMLPAADRAKIVQSLRGFIVPTLIPQDRETNRRRETAAAGVPPVELRIRQGAIIVRSGEVVTEGIAKQLEALRSVRRPRSVAGQFGGFAFFIVVLSYSVWRFFVHHQTRHRKIRNHMLLILVAIGSVVLVMRAMTGLAEILSERFSAEAFRDPLSVCYAIPFAAGAVLVTLLVDATFGIISSVFFAALVGLFYGDPFLGAYALTGSLAGIYSVRQYKDRAALLKAGLTIGLLNTMTLLAVLLLRQSPLTLARTVPELGFAYLGGILTSAVVSLMLPGLEWLFKITTDIRLLELSNLNAPILRRLSVEAPGTYHHSLMLGTLGEAAAEAIGANSLLVRVGAYYHDIGKMLKPEYFVENQVYDTSKHETLSPNMSTLIIASHVKDGLELAKQIGLAQAVRDMIPQHHGTRVMTYFYHKAKGSADDRNGEVVEADFRYPGPKPQTREAAILMMADAVEAASRTLSKPSPAQIQGMINRLIDGIVADGQFEECDITLRDIQIVKESFLKTLTGLYHRRVDYPGYDFSKAEAEENRSIPSSGGMQPAKAPQGQS
ncbi:MAG: HDIG domain-containing protein [Acidobacteria bacterium]|nr:HDIG domain-containing protein [Acidobacteriota bacterium]